MSLLVAVAGHSSVALASDSVRVDPASGVVTTGYLKQVHSADRIAGLAGIGDWDGVSFVGVLEQALRVASSLDDVPGAFLRAVPNLGGAFAAWRALVGPDHPPQEFLSMIAVSVESGCGEMLTASTVVRDGVLDFDGMIVRCSADRSEPLVGAIGAVDEGVLASTVGGRNSRWVRGLDRAQGLDLPRVELPPHDAGSAVLEAFAAACVTQAVGREGALPRPGYWPLGRPVLACPVNSASRGPR